MAKDLRVILGADLDITDINDKIKKIQETPLKFKIDLDTSGIKSYFDQMANEVNKNTNQNGQTIAKNAVDATSKQMSAVYQQLQKESKKIRSILEDEVKRLEQVTNSAVQTTINRGKKGNITSATLTYSDQIGKTVSQNYSWVEKEVQEVDKKTGEMVAKIQKSFERVGEIVKSNYAKTESAYDKLIAKAEKLKYNLTSGSSGIQDATSVQKLVSNYDQILVKVQEWKDKGELRSKSSVEAIEKEIQTTQRLTSEIKKQQSELSKMQLEAEKENTRRDNLGRTIIGDSAGFDFKNASFDDARKLAQQQLSQHLGKNVDLQNVAVNSFAKDNSTGKWLVNMNASIEDGKDKVRKYKLTLDEASNSMRILGESVGTTANRNLGFMESLRTAMQKIPVWIIGMNAFYKTFHFFTDGISYVNDLNKSLTQLSIVFNQSQEQVAKYNQEFHNLAMEMSLTTKEIAEGAVEFARQGLTQSEMIEKMKVASMYAKISSIDFNESAKILTATVNSMGISAEHAADIFSYMGDATATGAEEIGRAMQRVGGTAGSVGVQFEKLASWIAVVSSRTREGSETIGNAFKSIIARYQSIKEKGFAEEDGTNFNQVTKALNNIGIAAVDSNNQLRNFGDIMDELGAKWKTLDKNQRAYIATTVAGTYQQSRFLNIMEGYDDSMKLYNESLDQSGIALQKFNRFQEGTEAHLNRLKTAWTGVFQSSFDSSGIRVVIDFITKLASGFDFLVQKIGMMPIAVAALSGIMLLAGGSFGKFYKALIPTRAGLDSFSTKVMTTAANLKVLHATMGTGTMAVSGLKVAYAGLGVALKSLAATLAPMLAMMAIGFAIDKIASSAQKSREEARKQSEEIENFTINQQKLIGVNNNLIDQFKELSNVTSNGKTFANIEQEEKYYNLTKKISDIMPSVVKSIDEKGNVHLKNAEAIDTEIKHLKELSDLENIMKTYKAKERGNSNLKEITDAENRLKSEQNRLNVAQKAADAYPNKDRYRDQLVNVKESFENASYEVEKAEAKMKSFFEEMANIEISKSNVDFGDKAKEQVKKLVESLDVKNPEKSIENINKVVKAYADLQEKLNQPVEKRDQWGIDTDIVNLKLALSSIPTVNVDLVADSMAKAADKAVKAQEAVMGLADAQKKLQTSYEDTSDKMSIINGLLEDNTNGKQLNAKEVMELVSKDASMIEMFETENGMIKLNTDAINKKKKAMVEAFQEESRQQQISLINSNKYLTQKLDGYVKEGNQILNIAEMQAKVNQQFEEQFKNAQTYSEVIGIASQKTSVEKTIEELRTLQKQAEIAAASLNTVGTSNSTPSTKAEVRPYDEANVKKYKIDIDAINTLIKAQEQVLQTLDRTSEEYRNGVKEEISLQKQKQDAAHENAEALREQESQLKSQISTMGDFSSLSNDNKEKLNNLKKQLDDTTKSIDDMSNSWWDAYGKINELSYEVVTSKIEEFEMGIKKLDDALELSEAQQGIYKENSRKWADELRNQIEIMKQKQDMLQQEADLISENINNENLNSEQIRELTERMRKLNIEVLRIQKSISDSQEEIIKKRSELAKELIDLMKDQLNQQKDLMDDAYDQQIDSIEKAHDVEIDALEKRKKAVEEYIELKKKSYDDVKDERDYNQELNKKQQEAAQLQSRIDALSLDNSPEAKSKVKELKDKLQELNQDISNMREDRLSELAKDALDNQKDQLQKEFDAQKETNDKQFDQEKERLEKEKKLNQDHINQLINDKYRWSQITSAIEKGNVTEAINGLNKIETEWQTFVNTKAPSLAASLKTNLFDQMSIYMQNQQDRVEQLTNSLVELANRSDIVSQMQRNSADWYASTPEAQKQLEKDNIKYGNSIGASKNSNGDWVDQNGNLLYPSLYQPKDASEIAKIQQMKTNAQQWHNVSDTMKKSLEAQNEQIGATISGASKVNGTWYKNGLQLFHDGGIIGGGSNKTTNLINKMFNTSPNEQVVMALKDELMTPSKNIMKNFMPNLRGLVGSITPQSAVSNVEGDITIHIGSVVGDEKGAQTVSERIIKELKKRGKRF